MSLSVLRNIWDHSRAKGSEKLLLLAIGDHVNDKNGGLAWPGTTLLAEKTGLSRVFVKVLRARLVKLGELVIAEPGVGSKSIRYRVVVQKTARGRGRRVSHPVGSPSILPRGRRVSHVGYPGIPGVGSPSIPNPLSEPLPTVKEPRPPSESDLQDHCKSVGLRLSDGSFFFNKFEARGWPKNWQAEIKSYQIAGWVPGQKQGAGEKPKETKTDKLFRETREKSELLRFKKYFLEKYPDRAADAEKWKTFDQAPDYLRSEWRQEEKAKLEVAK